MTTEELLRAGILAAKTGDVARASQLLGQVVQTEPNSELGWLWLGLSRNSQEQREYCFRRVLAINPENIEARRQLDSLHKPALNSQSIKPFNSSSTSTPAFTIPSVELPGNEPATGQKPTMSSSSPKVVSSKSRKKKRLHAYRGWRRVPFIRLYNSCRHFYIQADGQCKKCAHSGRAQPYVDTGHHARDTGSKIFSSI